MSVGDITKCPCNNCGHETDHDVVTEDITREVEYPDSDSWTVEAMLKCRGCKTITVRTQDWWRDRIPDYEASQPQKNGATQYIPRRSWRKQPDWVNQIEEASADLHAMLVEVYSATNNEQVRLLAMGVRAVVDLVMTQRIGDIGGFEQKVEKMVDDGYLSRSQAETLEIIIDAGSAVAHRGFTPPQELLMEMVATMESMVRDLYISGPMMKALKTRIPPRPPRRRPT